MQAILIAGGAGTRLRPYTLRTPKPLLPLCGRPVVEYQLDLLKAAGVRRVVFAVGVMADQVRQHFGSGDAWGMSFAYALEPEPLGTAGAIRNCLPLLDGETSLVFNADVLSDLDLGAVLAQHRASEALATLTLTEVADPSRYGVITTDERARVTAFIEKPEPGTAPSNWINAGTYVLEEAVIRDIPSHRAVSIERETYPGLLGQGHHLSAFRHRGYWLDIGTAESYLQAHWDLLDRRCNGLLPAAEVRRGCYLGDPAAIPDHITLIPPVFIDAGVQFEGPATVGPYVCLNEGVRVQRDTKLTRVVALPGAVVGPKTDEGTIAGAEEG